MIKAIRKMKWKLQGAFQGAQEDKMKTKTTRQAKTSLWKTKLRTALLAFFLIGCGVAAPGLSAPAYAQCCGEASAAATTVVASAKTDTFLQIAADKALAEVERVLTQAFWQQLLNTLINDVIGGFFKSLFSITADGFDAMIKTVSDVGVGTTHVKIQADQALNNQKMANDVAIKNSDDAAGNTVTDPQSHYFCTIMQSANITTRIIASFRKNGVDMHMGTPYGFTGKDGQAIPTPCFNVTAGHANSSGTSDNCQGGTQSMVDAMKSGCGIGALDKNDIKGLSNKIGGLTCDTTVQDKTGLASPGTNPQIIFQHSVYVPPYSGNKRTLAPEEKIFQVQQYYCTLLAGIPTQRPVGGDITRTPTGAGAYHSANINETTQKIKFNLCMDVIFMNAAIPCNTTDKQTRNAFKNVCAELKSECNNYKKYIDVTDVPGCADDTGTISYMDLVKMESRLCLSPEGMAAQASGGKAQNMTPAMLLQHADFCLSEMSKTGRDMDEAKRQILGILLQK